VRVPGVPEMKSASGDERMVTAGVVAAVVAAVVVVAAVTAVSPEYDSRCRVEKNGMASFGERQTVEM